jgi:hypothetical protein
MIDRYLRRLLPACGAIAGLLLLAELALIAQTAAPAPAQSASLPPAAQIVKRFVDAIGGEAEFKKISSIRAVGTVEFIAQNISGKIEMIAARPSKMIMRGEMPDIGKFETGFDGKVGWEIDPASGPKLLMGRRLLEVADDARFDGILHGADHVKTVTTVAKTTFDNRPAYQIQVVLTSGSEETEYFDVETGMLLGSEASRETFMGVLPTIGFSRDYKKFGAIMQATTLVARTLGMEQVVRLTTFEFNTAPANTFTLPPQIKALINK